MDFLKRNINVILVCLLEVLIGVLLLVNPIGFTSGIVIVFGVALLISGLISVVNYFRIDAVRASFSGALAKGLSLLLAGAFCAFRPKLLIMAFPLITILYGVIILLAGLYKVQWFADALRLKTGRWFFHAISAVVSIVCAVIILANPFESTIALWMFIGISLIIEAVLDVVILFLGRNGSAS